MPTSLTNPLVQHIRRTVLVRDGSGLDDGQLLDRYIRSRDEVAFEALVRRHGPMVLGVCRRIVGDEHEAHDAFQATFLVLVKKAASVVPREMVGNFLHGVARQTAVRARSTAARRRLRESLVANLPEPLGRPAEQWDDLRHMLDEELGRLPEKYRAAVVSCDLEGRGHREAALHLGWPVGTLASRLARGRRMPAKRLARRGVAPCGAVSVPVLPRNTSVSVPASLVSSTVKAGCLYGAGQSAGAVSIELIVLTEGVLKAMSMNKIRMAAAVVLVASVVAIGGGLLACHAAADEPESQQNVLPRPDAAVKGGTKAVAADMPRDGKDRLIVQADGKQVRVQAVLGNEQINAVADRMSYDEASRRLVLEGRVRVQRRRGNEREDIECQRMVIDRKSGTVKIEGARSIGLALPMFGPAPVALDFGFPITRDARDREQVFNFFLGFTR
jgi:RNA polymerase sigma factor (sigma-70 family)